MEACIYNIYTKIFDNKLIEMSFNSYLTSKSKWCKLGIGRNVEYED